MREKDKELKNSLDPRIMNDLFKSLKAADNVILKKYVMDLEKAPCIEIDDALKTIDVGENVYLYKILKIVFDKNENTQEKLATVYSTAFSLNNCALAMILNGCRDHTDLYIGIVTRNVTVLGSNEKKSQLLINDKELVDNGKALRNTFTGNFPGIELKPVNRITEGNDLGRKDVINSLFKNRKYISSVSSIPAIRNPKESKNFEFIQGLEKIIDTMMGKEYSAIIIADAMSNDKIESLCAEYEDIYSQLSVFKASSETLSDQNSITDTNSIIKGITDTTNNSVSKSLTQGTASSKTHTDSIGGSVGVEGKIVKASVNYNHAFSRTNTKTEAETNTTTTGTAKSLTEQNSIAKSLGNIKGKSIQLNYENRAVKSLMDRIDEQIKRLRFCEDFGIFDTCAYFLSSEYGDAITAASVFRSITRGENSSIESSAVNVWTNEEDVNYIKEYLKRFYHPEFLTVFDEKHNYPTTPALLISGREMAYQMPLPKKSVTGVTVVECAEFAREVVSLSSVDGDISIGKIYHMHKVEDNFVKLDSNSLTSHTFITGSTGSGKSNTIYKLIDELCLKGDKVTKFLVIEPAKGEYKDVFGGIEGVSVYGTNTHRSPLLKLNPFSFPDEIHVLEHIDRLIEIFNACWPMYAAMPAVLKDAVEEAYADCGWNLTRSTCAVMRYPTFADVLKKLPEIMNSSAYSADTKGDYSGALMTRLKTLTNGINGQILCSDDEIPSENLFDQNVIIDLSRVGSMETKALLMGILMIKLQEYRMAKADAQNADLRHITILEEAHNLLRRTSMEQSQEGSNLQGKSVEMLTNAIAEMRTYGEGFIIADQAPGLLDPAVIRNTNTKIIMRLPDEGDRQLVGKAAGLNDDQIKELAKLDKGVAAVYQSSWIEPVLCKIDKFERKASPYKYTYDPQNDISPAMEKFFGYIVNGSPDISELCKEDVDQVRRWIDRQNTPQHIKNNLYRLLNKDNNMDEKEKGKTLYCILNRKVGFESEYKKADTGFKFRNIIDDQIMAKLNVSEIIAEEIRKMVISYIMRGHENDPKYVMLAEYGGIR